MSRFAIKAFEKTHDQDPDPGHQISRPGPWSPGLETKTLVTRSRDQNLRHQILWPRPKP